VIANLYPPPALLGSAFSPGSLSPVLWLDASGPLFTDAAGTAPATIDGDAVLNAPDRSTAGNTLTRPTGAGAVLRVENGRRTIGFEGGYLNRDVTSGSLAAFTLHAFFRQTSQPVPTSNPLMAFGAGAAGAFVGPNWDQGFVEAFTISTIHKSAQSYLSDATYRHLCLIYDGAAGLIRTFLDGAEVGPYGVAAPGGEPAGASFTRAGLAIGSWSGITGSCRVAELCYHEAAQSPADVDRFGAYFRSRWSPLVSAEPQVVWVSNSLATPQYANEAGAIPYLVGSASARVNRWVAGARGAHTSVDLAARVALDFGRFAVGPAPRIAVVWEGRNDVVVNGASAATAHANLVGLAQALRSAGYTKVVMGTVLPSNTLDNTLRATLNASIRANTTDWDAVADVASDSTMGADGANSNATNYVDGIHGTAAGNAILAPYFRAAIDGLLP
jgi:hypothetical protein